MNDTQKVAVRKHRIFVVDDHPIVRQGLALLINREADLTVCGEAEEAISALSRISSMKPDILIVDISLNGPDGLDLLKSIRLHHPDLPVLILSMHDEAVYAERALRAGANGYIMKQEATEAVLVAVRRILHGEIYVSERVAGKLLRQYVKGSPQESSSSFAELTDRELEVFRLIGEGHSTKKIADELHLSVKTVESYQSHLKEKLSLRTGRELVQHAIEWSLQEKKS
ncbi:MAG TPA: response regulator transcription factor [Candidatus Sulfotelmatobacter sp.]|nr:response regulator transcription factor [Candidatus Sulfotelmatobacter sp.]